MPENSGFARLTIQSQNNETTARAAASWGAACVAEPPSESGPPQIEIHFDGYVGYAEMFSLLPKQWPTRSILIA